jgi:O-acetyl-ADP-ribose deacetylase (regulator of RNase III)
MAIQYVAGDATAPAGQDPRVIVHVCNDIGRWGKGFVLAVSRRWRLPEQQFKAWFRGETGQPFALGEVQFVEVERALWVANLVGQRGLASKRSGEPPIRYDAVRVGLAKVRTHALSEGASVHMPRIGCGLAGGRWEEIEPIIENELGAHGVAVTVYDVAVAG